MTTSHKSQVFNALTDAELDSMFEVELYINRDIDKLKAAYRELRDYHVTETATNATRTAIELARQIHSGTRGELGHDRAEDALTIASFADAIVSLAELVSVERSR